MSKRAFFVIGPESSGNRYVTRCFIEAGCFGDYSHGQRLDKDEGFQEATDTVVFRRSVPHGEGWAWPNLDMQLERFRDRGYQDVRVVALVRNQYCTIESHLKGNKVDGSERHAQTKEQAEKKIIGAMRRIASFILENGLPFYFMTYESMAHPEFLSSLLYEWGLDGSKVVPFDDGNARHIAELRSKLAKRNSFESPH